MKLKEGLVLNDMGEGFVVISDDPNVFAGMIKLNKSGAFAFELLQNKTDYEAVIKRLKEKYDAEEETIRKDFDALLNTFDSVGLIEYD